MKIMKQKKILLTLMLLAFTSVLLTSCYPDYGLTTADFDIVATFKEDTNNFQAYRTFYITDEIKRLTDNNGGILEDPKPYDDDILTEITNQMIACGYTQIASPSTADVAIYVGATSAENIVYYPGYWGGYYGWYYPWYGYGGYAYSYTTGSLFVTMIDVDKFDGTNRLTGAVWAGTLNGILDDTDANILVRVKTSIDKMFEQSPYLKIIE
jgi:hypothetical protein